MIIGDNLPRYEHFVYLCPVRDCYAVAVTDNQDLYFTSFDWTEGRTIEAHNDMSGGLYTLIIKNPLALTSELYSTFTTFTRPDFVIRNFNPSGNPDYTVFLDMSDSSPVPDEQFKAKWEFAFDHAVGYEGAYARTIRVARNRRIRSRAYKRNALERKLAQQGEAA